MITRIILFLFSTLLLSCGGGGGGESDNTSSKTRPVIIANDIPIEVDAGDASLYKVRNKQPVYYSFAVESGVSYRVTLQSLSGDADFTLLDNQLLSDQVVVKDSISANLIQYVSYDASDNRTIYIAVSTSGTDASFKLYVNRQSTISSRPKIFVTSEVHDGSFASDRLIPGSDAIKKADYICSTSMAKPDDKEYKALLVDGLYRDAITRTDWVLSPDTTYYRSDGVIPIGTTSDSALFASAFIDAQGLDLVNSVDDCESCGVADSRVWTGVADTADLFTYFFSNCGGWSTSVGNKGAFGLFVSASSAAFGPTADDCASKHALYCVQQP